MATTELSVISNTYQNYFSKVLLEHEIQLLRLNQFALQAELPREVGADTISFFRPEVAAASNVKPLTEGVPPNVFRDVTYTKLNVQLTQYGEAAKFTDIVKMTTMFNALTQTISTMGEDCALHADEVTRDEIISNVSTAGQKRYAGTATTFAELVALTNDTGKLTYSDLLKSGTRLRINRAPTLEGGCYCAITPPQGLITLLDDPTVWLPLHVYKDVEAVYKGEYGKVFGVKVIEATNPWVEDDDDSEGTYAASPTGEAIYSTIVTGKGAYGVPKLAGTQSIPLGETARPQVMVTAGADKADPLNQFTTAGWKAFWAAKLLNERFLTVLRHKSTFTV